MSKATVLFASTTALLAVLSVYLAWALHTERTRADPVEHAVAQDVRAHEQRSVPVAAPPSRAETGNSRPAKAQAASLSKEKAKQSTQPAYRKRVPNQTYREAQLAYARFELEQQHREFATVLNVQPDEASRLFDLLAQQQLSEAELDAVPPGERRKAVETQRQAHRSELAAVLGDARLAEWDRYVNSLGARAQVRELRMLLAESDYPLRSDQYEPIVAALAAEQERHDAERAQLRDSQRDPNNPTYEEVIEYMGKRLDLIEASLARRRQVAHSHLDSEQLRRYESMLELERRRARLDHDAFVTANAEAARARDRTRP